MLLKEIIKQKLTGKISRCLSRKIFQMKISSVFIEKNLQSNGSTVECKGEKAKILIAQIAQIASIAN